MPTAWLSAEIFTSPSEAPYVEGQARARDQGGEPPMRPPSAQPHETGQPASKCCVSMLFGAIWLLYCMHRA